MPSYPATLTETEKVYDGKISKNKSKKSHNKERIQILPKLWREKTGILIQKQNVHLIAVF